MGWVTTAVGVGTALLGASEGRKAASQAADANQAALDAQKNTVNERFAFDKKVYEDGAADRRWASQNARQMAEWQAQDREKYNALQDEQIARGRKYQSAEDKMLIDADNFDTEGKREELAGKAQADVQQGFASAHDQSIRALARTGVNPGSGKALALEGQTRIAEALGEAGASNKARTDATSLGRAMKMDALGLGKGLIGNQATQAGLQLNSGNSSVSNGTLPINIQQSSGQQMSNGYGNAITGYRGLGADQFNSFINSQNFGAGVGANVGYTLGNILSKPGVTSGISNWFKGSSGDGWSPDQNSAATNDAMAASLLANGYGTGK